MKYIICKRYSEGLCAPSRVFSNLGDAKDQLKKDYDEEYSYGYDDIVFANIDDFGLSFVIQYDDVDGQCEERIYELDE